MSSATTTSRSRLRRPSPTSLLIGAIVVLAVVLAGARGLDSARTDTLDPQNPRPDGARAVAQVLEDLGVEVDIARGRESLDTAGVDGSTTVVVTSTGELGPSTRQHLVEITAAADAHVVYVEPGEEIASYLGSQGPRQVTVRGSVAAACDETYDELTLAITRATTYGPDGCFTVAGGAVLTEPAPGVTFLGAGQILHNGRITDGDNAAVALQLLGSSQRLVWYVPSFTDLTTEEAGEATAVLPDWIGPGLWLLLLAGLTLALWRGRRLGPLAAEPLPVVVHAIETTAGSGRLLRRGGDRAHAAAALRAAARRDLATHPHVGDADIRTLVAAVADRTGRTADDVAALIGPNAPTPPTDSALVHLGQELTALTEEVRHP